MLKGIDHLVVVVPDLEIAVRDYSDQGFTVVPGGRHPGGSRNALIGLADGAYIELLAFDAPNPQHRWWATFQRTLREGACLADFCMGTDNLEGDVRALRQAGVKMDDPHPGSRVRPDGYTVNWLISAPPAEQSAVVPFLIQDVTPRAERLPMDRGHQNRVTGIATLTIATSELARARQWFAGVLPSAAAQGISRPDLDATGVRLTIGDHVIDYVRPGGATSPLHAWLFARGPSPYAVTLRTSNDTVGPLLLGGR
jgi:catechol 2,3-dioxygenase-like lactoylglutathione lyase family enzyme